VKEEKLPEKAADRKIKSLLQFCAVIINMWIPIEKRNQYLNYFYSIIIDQDA
jgi:hypothetical protein|tara:strand:- start:1309 stop:1464 length:156 start_codon:yes stop_codon:yes gene_type:complete